ncbi:MAG: hypothetical protein ACTS2F_29930 [Thainema sp.]
MKTSIGFKRIVLAALLIVLAGCGSRSDDSAPDPAADTAPAAEQTDSAPAEEAEEAGSTTDKPADELKNFGDPANQVDDQSQGTTRSINSEMGSVTDGETVAVTLYEADQSCENLVPHESQAAANAPIDDVVGQLIADQNIPSFNLEGYSVNHNQTSGLVTVDFRVSPDSTRQLESLSSCEKLALFGGIEKTLTSDSRWQINAVEFTDRGEDVLL